MITFLNCEGEAYFQLRLKIRNQTQNGLKVDIIPIDSNSEYKISVFEDDKGLNTYNCRIIGFTIGNKPDSKSFVNFDKKGNVEKFCIVDTIKIDYSEEGESNVKTINVSDIRSIYKYESDAFEDMTEIKTFR